VCVSAAAHPTPQPSHVVCTYVTHYG
jgi:hypothetical protein